MITITEYALDRIAHRIEKRGRGIGIRIGIKATGCNGLAYVLEYVDVPRDNDVITICGSLNVYTDPDHFQNIADLTIDYRRPGLNEGFDFTNPKEVSRCGCGESFTI